MPLLTNSAEIDIRASADAAFAIVEGDLMRVDDDPGQMAGHRPVSEGPLRKGFRWRQRLVHERQTCFTEWIVTAVERPWLLEQSSWHMCAVARSHGEGGERWEFEETGDGHTHVRLRTWREVAPGLAGWLQLLPSRRAGFATDVRKRLAHVQFAAERDARAA